MAAWEQLVDRIKNPKGQVKIGIVGKYVDVRGLLQEPPRGPCPTAASPTTSPVDVLDRAEQLESGRRRGHAVAVSTASWCPGGSGRGASGGMIAAIRLRPAQSTSPTSASASACSGGHRIRAQRAAASTDANSTEVDEHTPHQVIYSSRTSRECEDKGGTMRLGAYPCELQTGSLAAGLYGTTGSWSATATATSSTTTTRAA